MGTLLVVELLVVVLLLHVDNLSIVSGSQYLYPGNVTTIQAGLCQMEMLSLLADMMVETHLLHQLMW